VNHVPSSFVPGTRIGPYCLKEVLGRGAFGEVWLAEKDSALAKMRLALKLPIGVTVDIDEVRKEAELWMRAASHPNVLPIFEADIYDGQVAIASEYAQDGSLENWLNKHGGKAPSIAAALEMAMGVLSGLEHLHVRGIVHRDLKPANILMQGECARIADFGLARLMNLDATGSPAAGTLAYMAPEAFDGKRTVQTDLWSVGIVLYEMLQGHRPFTATSLIQLFKAIAESPPLPLSDTVPRPVREIVATALNKAPRARFPSAADMRAALRDTLKQLDTSALPVALTSSRGCQTIAITGSMRADPLRTAHRLRALVAPYCGPLTTWYCGTSGVIDEQAATFLLSEKQRVIAVGYGAGDISHEMQDILTRFDAPFVNAQTEAVSQVPDAPSKRDSFFVTKADLVIVLWSGKSPGTGRLVAWLQRQAKDHVIGYL
jgi:serine/threonine protein kinase